jgi:geranylgeranyl diphosphate synthase, type III
MLYTASLLIDDIQHNSPLRRGWPVVHNIFGTAQTVNSANYIYFLVLQELRKLNNPTAIDICIHCRNSMSTSWASLGPVLEGLVHRPD